MTFRGLPIAMIAVLAAMTMVQAQDANTGTSRPRQTSPPPISAAEKYFTDVELIDQDGKTLRFYTDLIKGRTVVINVFFSTCPGVCSPLTRNLAKVQEALGDRLGRDLSLISISVDPVTDTPERLKTYAEKFKAKPGWKFLTGKKENVDFALRKLGQYVAEKNDHATIIIIGNEPTGLWKKAFGLANTSELIKIIEDTANDKPSAAK